MRGNELDWGIIRTRMRQSGGSLRGCDRRTLDKATLRPESPTKDELRSVPRYAACLS
jgi:hypothetical protein